MQSPRLQGLQRYNNQNSSKKYNNKSKPDQLSLTFGISFSHYSYINIDDRQ